jgi:hypothetical protein
VVLLAFKASLNWREEDTECARSEVVGVLSHGPNMAHARACAANAKAFATRVRPALCESRLGMTTRLRRVFRAGNTHLSSKQVRIRL